MKILLQLGMERLDNYRTTLMEDNKLLGTLLEPNLRNAIIVRRGEKRVLWHFCNLAFLCLQFLSQENFNFEEHKDLLESSLLEQDPWLSPAQC